ncbi:hypothetical protein [Neobacillus sp. DY30]|uniref:hypothetical protein n=1 Tax=Neobacillus sp. DY30 TaxID=3047871 RepID=UPI0024BFCE6C|nr:hypothetical protein [Neobacillus sp. DY30]WHX98134.1 hypothetical protein QNH29_15810 [Neobacillus sp. DY30]
MFLTWLMCISYFIGSYYITVVIFDRLKEKDQEDLAQLESQLQYMSANHKQTIKQAV